MTLNHRDSFGWLKSAELGAEALGNFSGPGPAATVPADSGNQIRQAPPSSQQWGRRNQAAELIGETAPGYLEQQAGFGTPPSVSTLTQLQGLMGGEKIASAPGSFLDKLASAALREDPAGSEVDFQSLGMLLSIGQARKTAEEEEDRKPGKKLLTGARSAAASARQLLTGLRSTAREAAGLLAQPTGRTVYTPRG